MERILPDKFVPRRRPASGCRSKEIWKGRDGTQRNAYFARSQNRSATERLTETKPEVDGTDPLIGPCRIPVPTMADYMPPNGFSTVSLLVTEVTPGTPFAISAALPTWEASVTVPFSVTAPSFATTLIFPALISLCFTMAL